MGTSGRPRRPVTESPGAVEDWLGAFDHPQRATLQAVREVVLSADPAIEEGIKWNSPSFRTTEWFATVNLRTKSKAGRADSPVAVILHLGAKKRGGAATGIDDPDELLEWLGDDRAMLLFASAAEVRKRAAALRRILKAWLRCVG